MSRPWTPNKKTVELRPSRIRREPAPPESRLDKVQWRTPEWEIRLAINIITVAISAYTS